MIDSIYIFYVLLFLIAFLYASVGHGGASGYLALMALYNITPEIMKPTALLLNLFVSLTAFSQFYRGQFFKARLFLPLALASVPMAFIGGTLTLNDLIYKKILGLLLIIPIVRFLFFENIKVDKIHKPNAMMPLGIGSVIGFLSGLMGIGGGILLSPVLLFLKWTDQKETAAISSLFIFVNSLSGLAGQFSKGLQFDAHMLTYVIIAFTGGLLGAWLGAMKFKQTILKCILAGVLLIAAIKLLFSNN